MASGPQVFRLFALDTEITMSISGEFDTFVPGEDLSTNATAQFEIPVTNLQQMFRFKSNATITKDASGNPDGDVEYMVNMTTFGDHFPNITNSVVVNGHVNGVAYAYDPENKVSYDFVRHLSYELFGTVHGVDLFSNKTDLVNDITTKGDVLTNVGGGIYEVFDAAGTQLSPLDNTNTERSNLTRELVSQLLKYHSDRFSSLPVTGSFFNLPIQTGDKLIFKLTINPATDQQKLVNSNNNVQMQSRSYKIELVAVN